MMHLPRSALNRGDGLSDRHQRGSLKDNWPGLVKKVTSLLGNVKFEIVWGQMMSYKKVLWNLMKIQGFSGRYNHNWRLNVQTIIIVDFSAALALVPLWSSVYVTHTTWCRDMGWLDLYLSLPCSRFASLFCGCRATSRHEETESK